MIMKPATLTVAVFLGLVALAHAARMLFQVEVVVDGTTVPQWVSAFGVLMPGALAVWLVREGQTHEDRRA